MVWLIPCHLGICFAKKRKNIMKKITVELGSSHNEFDRQLKNILNDMHDKIGDILTAQLTIKEHQNKLFNKHYAEALHSSICDICKDKADVMTTNLNNGAYKYYCDKCLSSVDVPIDEEEII
jgi:hypothetical protein